MALILEEALLPDEVYCCSLASQRHVFALPSFFFCVALLFFFWCVCGSTQARTNTQHMGNALYWSRCLSVPHSTCRLPRSKQTLHGPTGHRTRVRCFAAARRTKQRATTSGPPCARKQSSSTPIPPTRSAPSSSRTPKCSCCASPAARVYAVSLAACPACCAIVWCHALGHVHRVLHAVACHHGTRRALSCSLPARLAHLPNARFICPTAPAHVCAPSALAACISCMDSRRFAARAGTCISSMHSLHG